MLRPSTLRPTRDDRALSAALRAGELLLRAARSKAIPASDSLDYLQFRPEPPRNPQPHINL